MTREEINMFLADTKVYVAGKSEEIQKKLFSLGYEWRDGRTKVSNTNVPFLYIDKTHYMSNGLDMCIFTEHGHREISAEEILSLELTADSYRPFKNSEECWNEMLKHQPFSWIKHKDSQIYEDCRYVGDYILAGISFDKAYNNYTFADGTPFGIKEE